MQAIDIKRFTVTRIGIAAVAIGALAVGISAFVVLNDATSDSGIAAVPPSIERVPQVDEIQFLEMNTQLPAVASAPARTSAEILFLEQNTLLPDISSALTRSAEEILFLEMNTMLPAETAPKVLSFAEMLFLEMNTQQPGRGTLIPPDPPELLPFGGVTRY